MAGLTSRGAKLSADFDLGGGIFLIGLYLGSGSTTLTGAFMPAPVWNCQRRLPFEASSAVSRPSLRPTNISPPPVVTEPL